jgi:hypothetical protein
MLLGGSPYATAATWIGAGASSGAFVQVGTQEDAGGVSGPIAGSAPPPYYVFWSDATHRGMPMPLIWTVNHGDLVRARMVRTTHGWVISVRDVTTRQSATVTSSDGLGATFNSADWTQEDPECSGPPVHSCPYPKLSSVRLQRLELNGTEPAYAALYSLWLSLPGGVNLAPTPLVGDQFSLRPAKVSRLGERYLRDVTPDDLAQFALQSQMTHWTAATSSPQAARQAAVVAHAANTSSQLLTTQRWPAALGLDIRAVAASLLRLAAFLRLASDLTPARRAVWEANLLREEQAELNAAHRVRRALGLPEHTS